MGLLRSVWKVVPVGYVTGRTADSRDRRMIPVWRTEGGHKLAVAAKVEGVEKKW